MFKPSSCRWMEPCIHSLVAMGLLAIFGCHGEKPIGNSTSDSPNGTSIQSSAIENASRLVEAKRLFDLKQYARALDVTQQILVAEPNHELAAYLAAQCFAAQRKWKEASDAAEIVSDQNPQLKASSLVLKIQIAIQQGRLDVAEEKLRRMLSLYGPMPPTLHQLVKLLNDQGRRYEASEYIMRLARNGYAEPLELLALGTLSEPFHDDQRLQDAGSKESVTPSDLADAKSLFVQDKLQACRDLTYSLLEKYGDRPAVYAFAGRLMAFEFDEHRLQAWSQTATEAGRKEPDYWHAMGLWMRAQGRHAEAVRCFAENVERDGTDVQGYLYLGQALVGVGEVAAAEQIAARRETLRRVAHLYYEINFNNGGSKEFQELASMLDELYRPWEAFGWRLVDANHTNTMNSFAVTAKQQADRAAQREKQRPANWATCGVDKSKWPLPPECQEGWQAPSSGRTNSSVAHAQSDFSLPDVAASVGLNFQYRNHQDPDPSHLRIPEVVGGGIACIDFDLDGYTDLYFGQAGGAVNDANGSEPKQLFRNRMGLGWEKVTETSLVEDRGFGLGVCAADLNQDGFMDLLVGNIGTNVLFINSGDGTFKKQAMEGEPRWTSGFAVGDLTGDHLPDIIELNYIEDPEALTRQCWGETFDCNPRRFIPAENRYWKNCGDGSFEIWKDIPVQAAYSFAGVMANFDRKAGNDVFISCDTMDNFFWFSDLNLESNQSEQPFRLIERGRLSGCSVDPQGDPQASMGIAFGDFDRNGWLDLHVTNYRDEANNVLLQMSPGIFVDQAVRYGIAETSDPMVGFGTQAVDLDRDGWLDLAVLNGHVEKRPGIPFTMAPQLFRGRQSDFALVEFSSKENAYWNRAALGRTLAVLDWNRDGRPDLVANHLDQPVALLENQTKGGRWIRFELVGTISEREAIGTELQVAVEKEKWTSWVTGGDGYLCTNEPVVDFGLGDAEKVSELIVAWPSGLKQTFKALESNRAYLLVEGQGEAIERVE